MSQIENGGQVYALGPLPKYTRPPRSSEETGSPKEALASTTINKPVIEGIIIPDLYSGPVPGEPHGLIFVPYPPSRNEQISPCEVVIPNNIGGIDMQGSATNVEAIPPSNLPLIIHQGDVNGHDLGPDSVNQPSEDTSTMATGATFNFAPARDSDQAVNPGAAKKFGHYVAVAAVVAGTFLGLRAPKPAVASALANTPGRQPPSGFLAKARQLIENISALAHDPDGTGGGPRQITPTATPTGTPAPPNTPNPTATGTPEASRTPTPTPGPEGSPMATRKPVESPREPLERLGVRPDTNYLPAGCRKKQQEPSGCILLSSVPIRQSDGQTNPYTIFVADRIETSTGTQIIQGAYKLVYVGQEFDKNGLPIQIFSPQPFASLPGRKMAPDSQVRISSQANGAGVRVQFRLHIVPSPNKKASETQVSWDQLLEFEGTTGKEAFYNGIKAALMAGSGSGAYGNATRDDQTRYNNNYLAGGSAVGITAGK